MPSKDKGSEKKSPSEKLAPMEFNERVSRLLMVCIDGMCKLIPEKGTLHSNLKKLGEVVKKATRPKPITGLAREIDDFFIRLHLENRFRETKNEMVKQIVLDLTETIQQIGGTTGDFDEKMGASIQRLQSSGSIEDILTLKDGIINEIKAVQLSSQSLKNELNEYRKTTQSLSSQLEQTEAKALVDTLTNVLNRNAYNLKITQMMRDYSRLKEAFCLLVVDVDHFKKFNDNYGHKAGDRVLRSVADSIQGSLRASDLVFRYGGEEFVVILSGIQLEDALKLADKVRARVERDYYVDSENRQLKVTVSVGVSCVKDGDTELTLFERADRALYAAKSNGRNRVESEE